MCDTRTCHRTCRYVRDVRCERGACDAYSVNILFLGGPWDGTRQEVPDDLPRYFNVMPPEAFSVAAMCAGEPWPEMPEPVLYTLRGTLGGAPAYVAPGWPPPPKSCVVPGCPDPAREVFTAAERGRLAGREWGPGDEIDLCPPHGRDVRLAQYVHGVDQLAEWLRPDARADLLDIVGIGSGLGAEEFAASCAHALRVRR